MKHRILAALAVVCVSLSLSSCVTFEQMIGDIKAALAQGDKVVAANQDLFVKACQAGEVAHEQFVAQVKAGTINVSIKDQANEMDLYESGRDICYPDPNQPNTILPPDSLQELLAEIPAIQSWINQIAKLAGKVS